MYERLKHERHFLYNRVDQKNNGGLTQNGSSVYWTLQHRLHHIPVDILDVTQYPFIFSPNLLKYIDLIESNQGVTSFVVRDSIKHEEIIFNIPEELMSANGEEPI